MKKGLKPYFHPIRDELWFPRLRLFVPLVGLALAGCQPGGSNSGSISPSQVVPRFAYLVDSQDAISSFAVDLSSGQLRPNGYNLSPATTSGISVASGVAPALVVNSKGFIYMVARSATTLPQLVLATIDGPTGRLSPRAVALPGLSPLDVVGHPTGKFLYLLDINSTVQTASVDPANGNLTLVGMPLSLASIGTIHSLAVDPQGTFLIAAGRGGALPNYVDQVGTIAIDQTTGLPAGQWRRSALPFEPRTLVMHPSGHSCVLLPLSPNNPQIAAVSITPDGIPSNPTITTTTSGYIDLAFEPTGKAMFALGAATVTAFPVTDAITSALGAPTAPVALNYSGNTKLSVDPSGRFLYATSPSFNMVSVMAIGAGPLLKTAGSYLTRARVAGFAPVFTNGTLPVSYQPMFLYAVNYSSNDISIFSINAGGSLTLVSSRTSLGAGPFAIAIDPWSRFAFVANRDSATVAAFSINRSTGALSAVDPPVPAGTQPVALAIESSGRFLFAADNVEANVRVFEINQVTGQLTTPATATAPTFPVGLQATSLMVDPTGSTLFVSNLGGAFSLTAFTINQLGGDLGATGPTASVAISGYTAIGVDVRGELVFAGETMNNTVMTYPMNPVLANLAAPGGNFIPSGRQPVSLAVDPLGRFLYTANNIDPSISAYAINRNVGALASQTGVNFGLSVPPNAPRTVIVDPSGQFLYLADESGPIFAFRMDQASGALTSIAKVPTGKRPFALGIARLPL